MIRKTARQGGKRAAPSSSSRGTNGARGCASIVIGIGASAGGLKALRQFFSNASSLSGAACVVVMHLAPDKTSQLAEILDKETALKVAEARDGAILRPDHVYVIPPGRALTVSGGKIRLRPGTRNRPGRGLADCLFISLAKNLGLRAVGVVLSGTGADGTRGLEAIRAAGGRTLAQSPRSAEHPGMPENAIRAGAVDQVLPPSRMLAEIGRRAATGAPPTSRAAARPNGNGDRAAIDRILAIVHQATHDDFTNYKPGTIQRRIARRAALHKLVRLGDYADHLEEHPTETLALAQDLLIKVTSFFRDPDTFTLLKKKVFPALLKGRPEEAPLRIWVPGCSTGEEAYSIVITLMECFGRNADRIPVQVFATDRSETAIAAARNGVYRPRIEETVSKTRLREFFARIKGGYQIAKPIRDICVFARHDITRDPPFSKMDLISCRNVLIYLEAALQKQIIPMFHYALRPGGYLMLGGSERIITHPGHFAPVDRRNRIYVRKPAPQPKIEFLVRTSPPERSEPLRRKTDDALLEQEAQKSADRIVLSRFAPPSVIVSDDFEILRFHGDTSFFLHPAQGKAQFNLLKMIDGALLFELRQMLGRVRKKPRPVKSTAIRVERLGLTRLVTMHVVPVRPPEAAGARTLVVFESEATASEPPREKTPRQLLRDEKKLMTQLRQEVEAARGNLNAVLEEQDAMREEFKTANEEILSSNEELQSTNEELETAKEELQSANEELTTVNEELQQRNAELVVANDDISNLIASVDIPIVMLTRNLAVRSFTPKAEEALNLVMADVGQPLGKTRLGKFLPGLAKMAERTIREAAVGRQDIQDRGGNWYHMRLHPYRSEQGEIKGCVIVLFDIDELKKSHQGLELACEYSDALAETVAQPLVLLDPGMRLVYGNRPFLRRYGLEATDLQGLSLLDQPDLDIPGLKELIERSVKHLAGFENVRFTHESGTLGPRAIRVSGRWVKFLGRPSSLILLAIEDVTDREKRQERERLLAEERAARAVAENTVKSREEFLSMVAHELRTPLATLQFQVENLLYLRQAQEGEAVDSERLAKALKSIARQEHRLTRLVEGLLDLVRIRAGRLKAKTEIFDLAELARRSVERFADELEQAGVVATVAAEEPVTGRWDRALIDHAVANLLSNAIHYGNGKPIRIEVECDEAEARLRVRDRGIGVPAENRERLFQPFERIETRSHYGGLGLGLHIVRKVAEAHGGTVSVESKEGHGSTFTLALPRLGSKNGSR